MVNSTLPEGATNTIDDAIMFLGGRGIGYSNSWEITTIAINQYDLPIVKSLSEQLERGLALTEKQGTIGVRLVKNYQPILKKYGFDTDELLTKKPFSKPFRVIDKTKTLHIDGEYIVCKSPFIADLVNKFKKRKKPSYTAGVYDGENKSWSFQLNETNVQFLLNATKGKGFDVDPQLKEIEDKTKQIKHDGLDYYPVLTHDNKFIVKNVNIPEPYASELASITDPAQAIMFSKMLGCYVYDDAVAVQLKNHPLNKILLDHKNKYIVNKKVHKRSDLMNIIKASKQTVILVSSTDVDSLYEWINMFELHNLTNKTSVCFRYKKDNEANTFIKEKGVNLFDPTNKILITNEKIPKTFVKNDIKPNLVLVDLPVEPSHYKTQSYIANKPLVVNFTHKGDTNSGIL